MNTGLLGVETLEGERAASRLGCMGAGHSASHWCATNSVYLECIFQCKKCRNYTVYIIKCIPYSVECTVYIRPFKRGPLCGNDVCSIAFSDYMNIRNNFYKI